MIIIKEKSLKQFFKKFSITEKLEFNDITYDVQMFEDELFLMKHDFFSGAIEIHFIVTEIANISNTKLLTKYIYNVEDYDDFSIVLKLLSKSTIESV